MPERCCKRCFHYMLYLTLLMNEDQHAKCSFALILPLSLSHTTTFRVWHALRGTMWLHLLMTQLSLYRERMKQVRGSRQPKRAWIMQKKERRRKQGREVRPNSKYTGRKRAERF